MNIINKLIKVLDVWQNCATMGRKWRLASDDASVLLLADGNAINATNLLALVGMGPLWTAAIRGITRSEQLPEDIAYDVMGEYLYYATADEGTEPYRIAIEFGEFVEVEKLYRLSDIK